jgi:hypothetical protein
MKRTLRSRPQKLEAELPPEIQPARPVFGALSDVRKLPEDYVGPRHVAVVNRRRDKGGLDRCAYEERRGPALPGPPDPRLPMFFLTDDELSIIGSPTE